MVAIRPLLSIVTAVVFVACANGTADDEEAKTRFSRCDPKAGSIHKFMVETLDGQNTSMARYAGNVLVLINVATFCKYTEQYRDFNPLLERYGSQNTYITAFPCNQFHLQEPGNNSEILNGVQYVRPGNGFKPDPRLHIYGKLDVNGRDAHPMYKFLKNACPPTGDLLGELKYFYWDQARTSDIVWNFEKFIIDRQGRPRYRFHPGAWSKGKFVEQYLVQVLAESAERANPSLTAQQATFSNFVQQNQDNLQANASDVKTNTTSPGGLPAAAPQPPASRK